MKKEEITREITIQAWENLSKKRGKFYEKRNEMRLLLMDMSHMGFFNYDDREEIVEKLDSCIEEMENAERLLNKFVIHMFDWNTPHTEAGREMFPDEEEFQELTGEEKEKVIELIEKWRYHYE